MPIKSYTECCGKLKEHLTHFNYDLAALFHYEYVHMYSTHCIAYNQKGRLIRKGSYDEVKGLRRKISWIVRKATRKHSNVSAHSCHALCVLETFTFP